MFEQRGEKVKCEKSDTERKTRQLVRRYNRRVGRRASETEM